MTDPTPKMDVYSDMRVPFAVAAFCRGRKYLHEAVVLSARLRAEKDARAAVDAAQAELDRVSSLVRMAIDRAEAKMREEDSK